MINSHRPAERCPHNQQVGACEDCIIEDDATQQKAGQMVENSWKAQESMGEDVEFQESPDFDFGIPSRLSDRASDGELLD